MNSQISRLFTLFLIFWFVMTITGCGNAHFTVANKKADDKISQAVYEQLGTKMCYEGSSYDKDEEILYYHYVVNDYEEEDLLVDMVEIINEKMIEENISSRICLVIREVIAGGTRTSVSLYNYYVDESGYEPYNTLQSLKIWGAEGEYQTYNEVSAYENLKDIKAVIVEKGINNRLEEQEIDWYEIWPDLEHYDIFNKYERSGD